MPPKPLADSPNPTEGEPWVFSKCLCMHKPTESLTNSNEEFWRLNTVIIVAYLGCLTSPLRQTLGSPFCRRAH